MKRSNRFIILIACLALTFTAFAQLRIPATRVSFEFPNKHWDYLKTINIDKNTIIYVYSYNGHIMLDNAGDTVAPFMRVYVQRNYADSPYDLAYERYTQQPFQSLSESVEGLPSDGIAYVGAYTGASDKKDYQFQMIYFKDRDNAIEIRLETTRDTYEQMEQEFTKIMNSVKITK